MAFVNPFRCWTKVKGGKFEISSETILEEDQNQEDDGDIDIAFSQKLIIWSEYNIKNELINTFEEVAREEMLTELGECEVLLMDKENGLLIKLDKKNSRKYKIETRDFNVFMAELFTLKWDIIEIGFWE